MNGPELERSASQRAGPRPIGTTLAAPRPHARQACASRGYLPSLDELLDEVLRRSWFLVSSPICATDVQRPDRALAPAVR